MSAAFAFKLYNNGRDSFVVENAQYDPSGDEVQVRKVRMLSIKVNIHGHAS